MGSCLKQTRTDLNPYGFKNKWYFFTILDLITTIKENFCIQRAQKSNDFELTS